MVRMHVSDHLLDFYALHRSLLILMFLNGCPTHIDAQGRCTPLPFNWSQAAAVASELAQKFSGCFTRMCSHATMKHALAINIIHNYKVGRQTGGEE